VHLETVTTYWRAATVETRGDECVVRLDFPGRHPALHQLVAWGGIVTVLEPLDLVAELVAAARDVLAHYAAAP